MPNRPIRIAPSILSADFARLGAEIDAISKAGADWIHIDVMDGHFVPNLTLGPPIIKSLRAHSTLPFDVHLMITPADPLIPAFAEAGADILTLHPEAGPHLHRSIQLIKSLGKKAGVALNPATPLSVLDDILPELDLVLIMSVNPGFGGQKFIDSQLGKIALLRQRIDQIVAASPGRAIALEVDGGINDTTAGSVIRAGADTLVAGTAIFASNGDYRSAIDRLRHAA